jgi:phosphatidylserine/phosphatidylglycerophosphate/cardiolipin synthase-like enzyme
MKSTGVDLTANISTQPDVHNKGFVIDGKTVVVSSQNFSQAGIYENRDAGVILESPQIAQYFGPIFNADWSGALPFVAKNAAGTKGAKKAEKAVSKKPAKKGDSCKGEEKRAIAKRAKKAGA